jgi:hypothetical protein
MEMNAATSHLSVPDAALDRAEVLLKETTWAPETWYATVVIGRDQGAWRAEGPFLAASAVRCNDVASRASSALEERIYFGPVRVAELRQLWG